MVTPKHLNCETDYSKQAIRALAVTSKNASDDITTSLKKCFLCREVARPLWVHIHLRGGGTFPNLQMVVALPLLYPLGSHHAMLTANIQMKFSQSKI